MAPVSADVFCRSCGGPITAGRHSCVPREIKNPVGKGIPVLLTCRLVLPYIYGIIDAWRTAQRINRYGY
jgi:hypothetical protein